MTKQQRGERRSRGSGRTRRVDRFALCRTKRLREARRTEEVRRAAQASAAGVVGAARRGTTAGQRAWFICTVLMTSHEAMRRTYASGSTRRPHMEHVSNDNGRSSGSAVEAASPGGATSVANSSHMEHTTPTRVASSYTMSRTPLEASEKGGGAEMQLVGRAGVIQRRWMQPSRALSEDLTSTHESLMRAVIPGTNQLPEGW